MSANTPQKAQRRAVTFCISKGWFFFNFLLNKTHNKCMRHIKDTMINRPTMCLKIRRRKIHHKKGTTTCNEFWYQQGWNFEFLPREASFYIFPSTKCATAKTPWHMHDNVQKNRCRQIHHKKGTKTRSKCWYHQRVHFLPIFSNPISLSSLSISLSISLSHTHAPYHSTTTTPWQIHPSKTKFTPSRGAIFWNFSPLGGWFFRGNWWSQAIPY